MIRRFYENPLNLKNLLSLSYPLSGTLIMKRRIQPGFLCFLYRINLLFLFFFSITLHATEITSIQIHSSIGPAVADYFVRSISDAKNDAFILVELDTPGGLNKSMRKMISAILTSPVPVVVYVSPSGARAASAGTYLLYASTIAVMAPGTHVGAATPVNLSSPTPDTTAPKTAQSKKAINDATAYIRSLAQLRKRNLTFAEQAVLHAKTITASEALKTGVIDLIAEDNQALFQQLNGMEVTQNGKTFKLKINNLHVKQSAPNWRMKFLWIITDPTLAYLLLLLGIYGIFFELVNPGFIAPGVIGSVAILVALYALHLLPLNYAGLALILLGISFIIAEVFAPSFGILGLGGTVAFILGSVLLIDPTYESYRISWTAIGAMAVFNLLIFLVGFHLALRSRRQPLQNGLSVLIGVSGKTLSAIAPQGQALIHGEIWSVYSKHPIKSNHPIKVIATKGLYLEVESKK
jgi:membrane-bound serine protease (ClpP class)